MKAISTRLRVPHVLEEDRTKPSNEQTKFFIGPLTSLQWIEVQAAGLNAKTPQEMAFRMAAEACKAKLLGWENFLNEEGTQVKFPGVGADAASLVPLLSMLELGNEIMKLSRISGETVGKSESPSSSPKGDSDGDASRASNETQPSYGAGDAR